MVTSLQVDATRLRPMPSLSSTVRVWSPTPRNHLLLPHLNLSSSPAHLFTVSLSGSLCGSGVSYRRLNTFPPPVPVTKGRAISPSH
ncbi:predicted protein [Histoplasma capsulatum var. duboisii H88]|uniref:Predicted protein n=1 Tax=Ajellomyces capsulatus (strain H88) TaxID=544711 RepID=F0UPU7_AJEC8|nr:predicted protein [Histoplasma capsulatum var. duboisii H88]